MTVVLQTTLFPLLPPVIKPDLISTIVVIVALLEGKQRGAVTGLCYGAGLDLISGKYLGLNLLTLTALGYLVGFGERRFFKDVWLVPVIGILSATAAKAVMIIFLGWTVGAPLPDTNGLIWTIAGEGVVNTLIGVPLFFVLSKFAKGNSEEKARWNFN